MRIPKGIVTKNKLRDAKIIHLYAGDHKTREELSALFGISCTQISRILYANREVLKIDKEFEKVKRFNRLERLAVRNQDNLAKHKDYLDINKELRAELEGDSENGALILEDNRVFIEINHLENHSPLETISPEIEVSENVESGNGNGS